MIVSAVNTALASVGLSADQQHTARRAIARELRLIPEQPDPPA